MYGFEQMQQYNRFSWPTGIVGYILLAIGLYLSAKKANTKNPWVAFIPIVQFIVLLQIVDRSGWKIFWIFLPPVFWILAIIWMVKFFRAFEAGKGFIAITIITMILIPLSFIADILVLIVGLSEKYKFAGTTRFTA
jgi:hypothetical protein